MTANDGDDLALPLTRRDFEMPDERLGEMRRLLKIAEEHAGKCDAALELAIVEAQRDLVRAKLIPPLSELAGRAKHIQARIISMRADK